MCKVSSKLKLCSCHSGNCENLKHYWILCRPNEDDVLSVGEIMPPAEIGEEAESFNLKTISKLLNEGSCFDVEMIHREDDVLELHFTYKKTFVLYGGDYLVYAFVYKNSKWCETDYCPFHSNVDNIQSGEIVNPFLKE